MIDSVTERVTFFAFNNSHQVNVIRLFEARHSSKQIRLLLVQFHNQSFQNVPLFERHAYSRFGRLLHFCARRVEEPSNIHVSVFVVDRDVDGSTDVMMIVDALAIFVSSDVVVDIRE